MANSRIGKTCRCQSWRSRPPGFLSRRAPGSDAPGRQLSDQTLLRAGTLATTLCDISSNPRASGKARESGHSGAVPARESGRLTGSWAGQRLISQMIAPREPRRAKPDAFYKLGDV